MNTINIGTEIDLQDLIQSRMLIQANSGGGKSALARTLIEKSFGLIPFIVLDKEGEYYTLKEKFGDVLVIGGQFADIPINLKSAKLLPKEIIGNRLSVIIDLSDLNTDDKRLYVKYFLEAMLHLTKDYWIGYLIFIEEAHFFCGEQDRFESGATVKELMSTGRKRGYCGILITQRISKLHKDAAAECNNKFIGRTFLDIDMDRSAKELGFSSAKDRLQLRDLQAGHFFAFGTSIKPHHVHEVTIEKPATKLPKAGSDLTIQVKKPTDKIKAVLTKLNDLPQEAEKELRNMRSLELEVTRLKNELSKSAKSVINNPPSVKEIQQIDKLKQENESLRKQIKEEARENERLSIAYKKLSVDRGVLLGKIKSLIEDHENRASIITDKVKTDKPMYQPVSKSTHKLASIEKLNVYAENLNTSRPVKKLGKCPLTLLQFLASYSGKAFTNAQLGIATGYSPTSGGFNNALSELNTEGLINRSAGRISVVDREDINEWTGGFEPKEYNIETYISKLGKCEAEIYRVLLDNPNDQFSKEDLASSTPTNYSPTSGGFNNAISRLNTLELIKRNAGMIQLNPELLEV